MTGLKNMLLCCDIGNTNISLALWENDKLLKSWNIFSDKNKTDDEYGIILTSLINKTFSGCKIEAGIISSVVLPLTEKFKQSIESYFEIPVLTVSYKTNTGITLDVENPKEVGPDRIANSYAAYMLYKTPAVVVDFGTATNFDIITSDARFIGGIIAPGIKMCAESFSSFTNLLPKLKIEDINLVIGKNTIQNMLSGVLIGHASMIDGLLDRIEESLGCKITTIATGGFSPEVTRHMKRPFDCFNKHLTLEGLRLIYELNRVKIK
jgi:type III pantothenate kinase